MIVHSSVTTLPIAYRYKYQIFPSRVQFMFLAHHIKPVYNHPRPAIRPDCLARNAVSPIPRRGLPHSPCSQPETELSTAPCFTVTILPCPSSKKLAYSVCYTEDKPRLLYPG